MAEILADAVADDPSRADAAAARHAQARGRAHGTRLRGRPLTDVLTELGFEPDPAGTVLHNCPFHALASQHTALVCDLNHAFLSGLVDGLGLKGVRAKLAPRPGACCVELTHGR